MSGAADTTAITQGHSEPADTGAIHAPMPDVGCPINASPQKAAASDRAESPARADSRRSTAASITPAMRQYLEQKQRVGDAILLFRIGDFYETFFDDAKTIARVLGLTLTARNRDAAEPVPLAGVPYHAVDGYIAKLVRAGYKVALSEQLEDPKQAKGVIRRDVVRVITPGTLTDETLLDERSDNYLAALCPRGSAWPEPGSDAPVGLACIELASGRFFAQTVRATDLGDELARLRPAELIVPESAIDARPALLEQLSQSLGACVTQRAAHVFDAYMAERALCAYFEVATLAGFGFAHFDASLCAAAAILDYLNETQKSALKHITTLTPRHSERWVMVDQVTLRALEVERTIRDGVRDGSLLGTIDRTVNPMGARRLREWLCFPLRMPDAIRERQDAIAALRGQPDRLNALRGVLRDMGDIERIAGRLGVGRASPRDLAGLGRAMRRTRELADAVGPSVHGNEARANDLIAQLVNSTAGLETLGQAIAAALKDDAPPVTREGGFIADGYDAELDRLRHIGDDGQRWLAEFQAREIARTGIGSLRVGFNSVFGYYIEVTHTHRDKVPADYVRRQTVRNAERYITDELKRHEQEVLGAEERALQREVELFEALRAQVAAELPRIGRLADAIASLDVLAALAELARRGDYCRPELVELAGSKGNVLEIVDGRHPVLDATMAERFVPNDCRLEPGGDQLLIITGPNMAGKSTYIRQVALLVLMAQAGSCVPAKSMRWSGVDRIFARVGASDELARGQSTFMVEMIETARIMNNATSASLVILDEIGRGTSTYDGLSIAWAMTEHIVDRIGCRALFATHYHELTELAGKLAGVANFNVAVREQLRPDGAGRDVVFLHRIVPGAADRSYGVHVAGMAGLPRSVVRRSETILAELENRFARASRSGKMTGKAARQPEQPLLFAESEPLPVWWRDLVDALQAVDVDGTTPVAALAILARLKATIEDRAMPQ